MKTPVRTGKAAEAGNEESSYYFEDMKACPCPELFSKREPWLAVAKTKEFKFTGKIEIELDPTIKISGKVAIGKGTRIDPYVVIEGPARIGRNCEIRAFALIRPGTILGDDVVVGHASEVKNVIAFDGVKMASHVFVGDSVLGKGARIASGTIVGNRRFDQKKVEIRLNGKAFKTGKEKFGCVIGDFARLGACCATSPGTLVGPYTWTYSNMTLRGFYPKDSLIKLRQQAEIVPKERQALSHKDGEGHV